MISYNEIIKIFTPTELEVCKIAKEIYVTGEIVTTDKVMAELDKKYNYSKPQYSKKESSLRTTTRSINNKVYELFDKFTKTEEYKKGLDYIKRTKCNDRDFVNHYIRKTKRYGIWNSKQIKEMLPKEIVFSDFLNMFSSFNIAIFISGRGNEEWRIPGFADFNNYRMTNMTQSKDILSNRLKEEAKGGDAHPITLVLSVDGFNRGIKQLECILTPMDNALEDMSDETVEEIEKP